MPGSAPADPGRRPAGARVRTGACTAWARPSTSTTGISRACCSPRSSAPASPPRKIKSIDTREAEAMPGVVAVITGKDMPCNSFGPSLKDQPVLADTRVFHAGDGVAAVAAVTEQIAAEALDKIKVEYEILTPVLDPARIAEAGNARRACAERQHLRPQAHQEGRRGKGVRRILPSLRGHLAHADGRTRAARAPRDDRHVGSPMAASRFTRRWAASRWAAPTWPARWAFP